MGMIITKCPVTGQDIPTGVETDAATMSRIASIVSRVWCPVCEREHEWSVESARLDETWGRRRR